MNNNTTITKKYGTYNHYIEEYDDLNDSELTECVSDIVEGINKFYTFLPEFITGYKNMDINKDTMEIISDFTKFYGNILNNTKREYQKYWLFKVDYTSNGITYPINYLVTKNDISRSSDEFNIKFYVLNYIPVNDFKELLINTISEIIVDDEIFDADIDAVTDIINIDINYMTEPYNNDNEEITNRVKSLIEEK